MTTENAQKVAKLVNSISDKEEQLKIWRNATGFDMRETTIALCNSVNSKATILKNFHTDFDFWKTTYISRLTMEIITLRRELTEI